MPAAESSSSTTTTTKDNAQAGIVMGSSTSNLATLLVDAPPASGGLKRRASSPPRDASPVQNIRKRARGEADARPSEDAPASTGSASVDPRRLVDELAEELSCACCSAIVYRPVVVMPCQHFFCGSCCALWIRNGGTDCPTCRSASTSVLPSRPLQSIVDLLLRTDPSYIRSEAEREQADEVYTSGPLRIPFPRDSSPPPTIPQGNGDYARPCAHCVPNPYGWRCPNPIRDPDQDPDQAWHLDEGNPPGHAYCGNCEDLLALAAPATTKCDMCQVSFCGIGVQGRCVAASLTAQYPHGFADLGDMVQSSEVYDCFDGNSVEVEYLLDYLTSQSLTPRDVYREIVNHIQGSPTGFAPLLALDIFADLHAVGVGAVDPDPAAPRRRICRLCAAEVLLWGLRDWWARERAKGAVSVDVLRRADCLEGRLCTRQKDLAHAREFNHIAAAPVALERQVAPMDGGVSGSSSAGPAGVTAARFLNDGIRRPIGAPEVPGHEDLDVML